MKKTWNCVCVVKPNDKTSDTDDDVTTKTNPVHMKRDTSQVNVHVVFLLVRVVVIFTHCTPHRVVQVVRVFALISSMHEVSDTLRLRALHSIQLPLLFILLKSPAVPAVFLLPLRIRSNTVYSAIREMGFYGRIQLQHIMLKESHGTSFQSNLDVSKVDETTTWQGRLFRPTIIGKEPEKPRTHLSRAS